MTLVEWSSGACFVPCKVTECILQARGAADQRGSFSRDVQRGKCPRWADQNRLGLRGRRRIAARPSGRPDIRLARQAAVSHYGELSIMADCRPTQTTADWRPIFAALAPWSCPQVTGSFLYGPVAQPAMSNVGRWPRAENRASRTKLTYVPPAPGHQGQLTGASQETRCRPQAVFPGRLGNLAWAELRRSGFRRGVWTTCWLKPAMKRHSEPRACYRTYNATVRASTPIDGGGAVAQTGHPA